MNLRGRYSSIVIALLLTWGVGGDRLVSAATFYVALNQSAEHSYTFQCDRSALSF